MRKLENICHIALGIFNEKTRYEIKSGFIRMMFIGLLST